MLFFFLRAAGDKAIIFNSTENSIKLSTESKSNLQMFGIYLLKTKDKYKGVKAILQNFQIVHGDANF